MHHLGGQPSFLPVKFSPCASSSLPERERHARPPWVLEYLPTLSSAENAASRIHLPSVHRGKHVRVAWIYTQDTHPYNSGTKI